MNDLVIRFPFLVSSDRVPIWCFRFGLTPSCGILRLVYGAVGMRFRIFINPQNKGPNGMKKLIIALLLGTFFFLMTPLMAWDAQDEVVAAETEAVPEDNRASTSDEMPVAVGEEAPAAIGNESPVPLGKPAEKEMTGTVDEFTDLQKTAKQNRLDYIEQSIQDLRRSNQFLSERVRALEGSVEDLKDRVRMT